MPAAPAPPGEVQVDISPALWLAIKNTERGLTGSGPGGLLRLKAGISPDAAPSALEEFLAKRGGTVIGNQGPRAVLLDIPAMYAPELWLLPAVASLEPVDGALPAKQPRRAARYLIASALAVLLALGAWMGLDRYRAATESPVAAGEKAGPSRPDGAGPKPAAPPAVKAPENRPPETEKPVSTAKPATEKSPAVKAPPKEQARPAKPAGEISKTGPAPEAAPQPKAVPDPEKAEAGPDKAKAAQPAGPAPEKAKAAETAETLGQRAMEAMWGGDAQKAAELLRRGLKKAPGHLGLRTNLGLALMELGRLEEAEVEFKEVLRLKPGDQEALSALQLIRRAQKD